MLVPVQALVQVPVQVPVQALVYAELDPVWLEEQTVDLRRVAALRARINWCTDKVTTGGREIRGGGEEVSRHQKEASPPASSRGIPPSV